MLVGVLIVFLMISMVAIAIINRSLQGTVLTVDSKKGYATYQNSDSSAESFLDKFKSLDNGTSNQIPENTSALSFCGDTLCYKKDGTTKLDSTKSVSDIFNFKTSATVNDVTRTIFAPVPDRIDGKLGVSDLEAKNCDGIYAPCNGSYNKCDIGIKVDARGFDSTTMLNYEIRKSINSSLAFGASSGEYYGWQRVPQGDATYDQFFAKDGTKLLKNGDSLLSNQYGQTYYFTIKARHKNPFSLDSLYLDDGSGKAPQEVLIDSAPKCSGTVTIGTTSYNALDKLGCVTSNNQPAGTETFKNSYNCCNGTECYMPSPHWTNSSDNTCALELCDNSDQEGFRDNVVPDVPSGIFDARTTGLGWCGTAVMCVPGRTCKDPYRYVGYCNSPKDKSSQYDAFLPVTDWKFNNFVNVNMNIVGNAPNRTAGALVEPRCSYHTCPAAPLQSCGTPTGGYGSFSASLSCNNTTNCGPYTATVSCNLSCDSGYYPAVDKASSTTDQVTISYPNKSCCYKDAPSPAPTCASAGYSCGWFQSWVPICGSGSWSTSSCWNPHGCGPAPTCSCGTTGSCTDTCSGVVSDTRSCTDPTNFGTACYSGANNCGDTNTGTIQCDGSCSASVPADIAPTTCCDGSTVSCGASCTVTCPPPALP